MKKTVITTASLLLRNQFKNIPLLLLCVTLTGCNIIGEDEPDLNNLPLDTEKNYRISNGVLTKYNGRGGDITIPSGVVAIDMEVFENDHSLTSVVIPEGVKIIGSYAFAGCTRLTSVSLPSTLQYIENSAFENCTALISITIPVSVKKMGYGAFGGCTALKTVSVGWGIPLCAAEYSYDDIIDLAAMVSSIMPEEWRGTTYLYHILDEHIFEGVDLSHATLKVLDGIMARYENAQLWGTFGTIEEDANIAIPADGLATKPAARSTYDNQSGGIYKGVIAGTSGSFVIDLQGTKPQATVFYNGSPISLKISDNQTFASGQATVLYFNGTYFHVEGGGYGMSLSFSVEADGSNPQARVSGFIGNQMAVIEKELSTTLVEVYEGIYSGSITNGGATNGTFNIVIKGNKISGLCDFNQSYTPYILSGTINDGNITATGTNGEKETSPLIVTGSVANGSVSGSFNQNLSETHTHNGTWSGRRMF